MRTTLTIDDDVAAVLVRLRKARGAKLRDLINEALRRGLEDMSRRPKERRPFRTRSVDLGPSIDNVSELLSIVEGDAFK